MPTKSNTPTRRSAPLIKDVPWKWRTPQAAPPGGLLADATHACLMYEHTQAGQREAEIEKD
jgi:hypothetical protein